MWKLRPGEIKQLPKVTKLVVTGLRLKLRARVLSDPRLLLYGLFGCIHVERLTRQAPGRFLRVRDSEVSTRTQLKWLTQWSIRGREINGSSERMRQSRIAVRPPVRAREEDGRPGTDGPGEYLKPVEASSILRV